MISKRLPVSGTLCLPLETGSALCFSSEATSMQARRASCMMMMIFLFCAAPAMASPRPRCAVCSGYAERVLFERIMRFAVDALSCVRCVVHEGWYACRHPRQSASSRAARRPAAGNASVTMTRPYAERHPVRWVFCYEYCLSAATREKEQVFVPRPEGKIPPIGRRWWF